MLWGQWPRCLLAVNAPSALPHFAELSMWVLLFLGAEVAKNTSLVLRNCRVRGGKPLTETAQSHPLCAEGKLQTPEGPRKGFVLSVGFFGICIPSVGVELS